MSLINWVKFIDKLYEWEDDIIMLIFGGCACLWFFFSRKKALPDNEQELRNQHMRNILMIMGEKRRNHE